MNDNKTKTACQEHKKKTLSHVITFIYRVYQLCIVLPLGLISTILTALVTTAGCAIGAKHIFGYYPAVLWSKTIVRLFLLPVKIKGRENLDPNCSYVFVSNHQGAFDIFLIFGYLDHQFKWMMKHQLGKIPFVGFACKASDQIFVDRSSPKKVKETYNRARSILQNGMSVVVFPEGARSYSGHPGVFKKGAFLLADELQLPIVPLTINGTFEVMPRTRDWHWVNWHKLTLTIHPPINPLTHEGSHIQEMMSHSYEAVVSDLDTQYRGFETNLYK